MSEVQFENHSQLSTFPRQAPSVRTHADKLHLGNILLPTDVPLAPMNYYGKASSFMVAENNDAAVILVDCGVRCFLGTSDVG